ncbi:Uncharacterized protein OBRU01_01912 [Operophtera brumata]|uniref:Uncharacterized protein n=1 Tax=Operophtera brumata TaxID=104452 RepID=A0A0L7LFR6_OPEBR|nr:Uncharacterized protein OBRU01_01912 [Operophtera brumata]
MDNSCLLDLLIRCFAMTEPEDLNFTAFTDLCRLCSLKSGPRLHIFDKESEQRQILFKLRTCLPTMISKDDFLPKKICERCITRVEQLYEWRQSCLSTDSAQNNNAHQGHPSPPTVSSTQHHYGTINSPIKVPQVSSSTGGPDSTFTVPDDVGMGFEGGVRVLQSLGNWSPEVTNNIPRPNLIPFTEPYAEGGSMHPGTRLKALQGTTIRKHPAIKPTSSTNEGSKAFECTVCGKGLARKDKLTIHMRIHTGEKPYVCEVCNKAFARRDKLVLHMNKLKHITPSNIAPLGKRAISIPQDTKPSQAEIAAVAQQQHHQQPIQVCQVPGHTFTNSNLVHTSAATAVAAATAGMVVSWSCELCGRLFATRDEWSAHAKSHLPDNKLLQDKMQQATQQHQVQDKVHLSNQEKLQLLHHHNQNQQILNGHIATTSSVSSATVVNEGGGGGYFTHGHNHYTQERQHTHAHHLCLMCRQEFTSKAEFMFHVRGHFEGKVSDIATADVLARSLVDNSGLCT